MLNKSECKEIVRDDRIDGSRFCSFAEALSIKILNERITLWNECEDESIK